MIIKEIIKEIGPEGEILDDGKEYRNCKIVYFEGKEYIVSNNTVVTINVTDKCNANCKFCYNGLTFYPSGEVVKYEFQGLDELLAFAEAAGIENVAISGGEPTLVNFHVLEGILKKIEGRFKDYRFHSNGANLFRKINGEKRLIDYLIQYGFKKISLSVAHYDPSINKTLMRYRGLPEGALDLFEFYSDKVSFRLSCLLNKEGIDSPEEVEKYIAFYRNYGVRRFIFRGGGLSHITPPLYVKDTFQKDFFQAASLPVQPFVDYFKSRGWKEVFALHKDDIHVHVLEKDGVIADFEEAGELPDPDSKIRRLNYFVIDGVTYTSWIDPNQILFEKDISRKIADILSATPKKFYNAPYPSLEKDRYYDPQGERVGDFHVHSLNSDGKKDVSTII